MTATINDTTITTAAAPAGPRRSAVLPPVHPAAWQGLLGEAVCKVAPATEADPVAILVSALALFGAMAGPDCYVRLGGVRHPPAIWPLVVGKTGSGRKGTSLAEAKAIARQWGPYAHAYTRTRLPSGLSSGEGLLESLGADHGTGKGEDPDREAAAPDGRLTVVETEFARVLTAAKRDGNTLGPILRQLWDEGAAGVMTRARPLQVDGAHVGMIAHVTPRELRLKLAEADLAGGTVNRFLIVASERPHLLPHEPPRPDIGELAEWIGRHLEQTRSFSPGEVRRDRHAEALWPEVYAALSADEPDGIIGQVLARGPAYVMRLALGFALVDGSSTISKPHLLQGLAVWHYSVQSVRLVFNDTRTQSDLRRLAEFIAAAGDEGRTRSEVYRLFSGHLRAEQITTLIEQLERTRQVTGEREETTAGRPAYRYRWAGRPLDPIWHILSSL